MQQRDDPQLRIRLPKDVKEWLAQTAERNLRTQSAEIAVILREQMEQEQAQQK